MIYNDFRQNKVILQFDDAKEVFLVEEWSSFHPLGKKLDYLPSMIFSNTNVLEATIDTTNKIIIPYRTLNHRLAIGIGWCLTIPIPRDTIICHLFVGLGVERTDTSFTSIP